METETLSTLTARERVERGAAFLDENVPGWIDKITESMDVSYGSDCVLAQVYGSFYTRPAELDTCDATVMHGFERGGDDPFVAYWMLQVEWDRLIAERKAVV